MSEFIEGRRDTELRWSIGGEFVVATADVLNKGVPGDDGSGADVGSSGRASVAAVFSTGRGRLDPVVGVALDAMPRLGNNLAEETYTSITWPYSSTAR